MKQKQIINDHRRPGQLATRKETFGDDSRFAVAAVHTRFDAVQWFVWDAETVDHETGLLAIVAQAPTKEAAVSHALKTVKA